VSGGGFRWNFSGHVSPGRDGGNGLGSGALGLSRHGIVRYRSCSGLMRGALLSLERRGSLRDDYVIYNSVHDRRTTCLTTEKVGP
jgi:hypothetical protein